MRKFSDTCLEYFNRQKKKREIVIFIFAKTVKFGRRVREPKDLLGVASSYIFNLQVGYILLDLNDVIHHLLVQQVKLMLWMQGDLEDSLAQQGKLDKLEQLVLKEILEELVQQVRVLGLPKL